MKVSAKNFFTELYSEIVNVSFTLFKIMIPIILIIKVLEEMGGVALLGQFLAPVMNAVGLPSEIGIVWAATITTNIYAGMLVFFNLSNLHELTVAQVTVLSCLMLMAHGLPIEAAIAKKAGVRLRTTLIVRLIGGFIFALLLHHFYQSTDTLQEPVSLAWQPSPQDPSLSGWLLGQLESLLMIQLLIIVLLTLLKILRTIKVDKFICWLLRPLLKLLGIGDSATNITLIGVTLGLSFGGALLIKEAESGEVKPIDVFAAMTLLSLCHSLIEDTLLVMLLGAHLSGVLWGRLAFSFVVTALINYWAKARTESFQQRFLFISVDCSDKTTP